MKSALDPNKDVATGSKFDSSLSIVEIAKRVRKDIKAAVAAGTLGKADYSVTIKKYSGGRSLRVEIKNPSYFVHNIHRIRFDARYPEMSSCVLGASDPAAERYTQKHRDTIEVLHEIVDAYNYDDSDSMVDYFNVNFYSSIDVCFKYQEQERAYMLALPANVIPLTKK